MRPYALFRGSCALILAIALACGCGPGQQTGTLSNPSAKAVVIELADALDAYDASLSAAASAPGEADVGEDPASILGGVRTRVNSLQQMTAGRSDVQEVLKAMSNSLDALEKLSRTARPDVAQNRQELEKLKAHVDDVRKKL